MFLTANSKTPYAVVIVILDNFISLDCIAEIVLIEHDQLLLLIPLDNVVKLRVSAAIRNPCIANLHKDVHLVRVLFDQSQRLLHVTRKPVYMLF